MEVQFKSRKLQKVLNSEKEIKREYGKINARNIMRRLSQLEGADTLAGMSHFSGARCHPLKGRLTGKFALDLKHPFRLLFEPNHDPLPLNEDGSLNLNKITKIIITEIIDYH